MTFKEMMEVFERRPDILDLCVAYIEAKESNPKGVEMALPIILKILTDKRKQDMSTGIEGR